MTTKRFVKEEKILTTIRKKGGLHSMYMQSRKEIAEYIFENFYCTTTTACNVAWKLWFTL